MDSLFRKIFIRSPNIKILQSCILYFWPRVLLLNSCRFLFCNIKYQRYFDVLTIRINYVSFHVLLACYFGKIPFSQNHIVRSQAVTLYDVNFMSFSASVREALNKRDYSVIIIKRTRRFERTINICKNKEKSRKKRYGAFFALRVQRTVREIRSCTQAIRPATYFAFTIVYTCNALQMQNTNWTVRNVSYAWLKRAFYSFYTINGFIDCESSGGGSFAGSDYYFRFRYSIDLQISLSMNRHRFLYILCSAIS